jgi:hypothetical protein
MEVDAVTTSTGGRGRRRDEDETVFEGSWVWIALPVGILALIAALWFLVIAPAGSPPPRAAATPAATATISQPTVTPMVIAAPTEAPTPTAPAAVGLGARVEVAGTGVSQLRVRQLPGTDTVTVRIVPDGSQFVVIGGPEEIGGYTWWKVDDQSGTAGWVAAEFLKLAP